MQKLILCGDSKAELARLQKFLESRLPYEVMLSFSPQHTKNLIASRAVHLLLYDKVTFSGEDYQFTKDLRSMGFMYPILALTETVSFQGLQELSEQNKIHFLIKPYEARSLKGLVRKLMTLRYISHQQYRRFPTNQPATVEAFISGNSQTSQMFNLSQGGAYFEFKKRPDLTAGDLVRLKVRLDELAREYAVNARVVWVTHKGSYAGGPGVGVQFVKGSEVYRHLIDKV